MRDSRVYCGKVIFDTTVTEDTDFFADFDSYDISKKLTSIRRMVDKILDQRFSWAGVRSNNGDGEIVNVDGQNVSAVTLLDWLTEFKDETLNNPAQNNIQTNTNLEDDLDIMYSLIVKIHDTDKYYKGLRLSTFETYLGADVAKDFSDFFNVNFGSGMGIISIPELNDPKKIPLFVRQTIGIMAPSPEDRIKAILDYLAQFYKEFSGTGLSAVNYSMFLSENASTLPKEWVKPLYIKMAGVLDDYMLKVETLGNKTIAELVFKTGAVVTDKEIDELRGQIENGGTTPLKSKLL
jgi:hypothetical protein